MAGKHVERFVKKQIAKEGGWERVKERYASGETIAALARTFLKPDGTHISRQFVYRLIDQVPGLLAELQALKPQCAASIFEKSVGIADDMPADRDCVLRDKAKADIYLKVAGLMDREQFGEQHRGVNVQVNLGEYHLNALRHRVIEANRPVTGTLADLLPAVMTADSVSDSGSAADCEPTRQRAHGTSDSDTRIEPEGTQAA
jgi:hypothetical protein